MIVVQELITPTSKQKKTIFFSLVKGELCYRKSLKHSSVCKKNKGLYIFSENHPDLWHISILLCKIKLTWDLVFFPDMRALDLLRMWNSVVCKLLLPGTGPTATVWQKNIYNCSMGLGRRHLGKYVENILFLLAYMDEKHRSQDHVSVFLDSEMKVHEK